MCRESEWSQYSETDEKQRNWTSCIRVLSSSCFWGLVGYLPFSQFVWSILSLFTWDNPSISLIIFSFYRASTTQISATCNQKNLNIHGKSVMLTALIVRMFLLMLKHSKPRLTVQPLPYIQTPSLNIQRSWSHNLLWTSIPFCLCSIHFPIILIIAPLLSAVWWDWESRCPDFL